MRRIFVCLLLLVVGCRAQAPVPAELQQKIEKQVRATYSYPPYVDVTVSDRKPSKDFAGYDDVTITLSFRGQAQTRKMLISKDGQSLIAVTRKDLTKAPLAETMAKINMTGRPVRGNKSAKVTIVVFDDFQCPYCSKVHQTLLNLMQSYGDRVKVIYKDYPLYDIHPWSERAALDSGCLARQGDDPICRLRLAQAAFAAGNAAQRRIHVPRHAGRIAADVEMRPLLQPAPQVGGRLQHAVLHVQLVRLVARERGIQPRQRPILVPRCQFCFVQKIRGAVAFAEDQPGLAARAGRRAVRQEGAERRDASAWANHNHRHRRFGRQAEMAGLDIGVDRPGRRGAIGQERAGDTVPHPAASRIAHHRDAQMHLARRRAR